MSLSTLPAPGAAPTNTKHTSEPPARRRWYRRPLWWIAALIAVLWLEQFAISLIFQSSTFRALLDERLEFAFGRPVHVGRYSFSQWEGPELEAESVTVDEDPRFGYEYFLRAEKLTARLRWQSLLRGQIELGTISFSHPSLNLVRAADGEWNVEAWLPAPTGGLPKPSPAQTNTITPRVRRIEVDTGRINFKRGVEKTAFAFVNVNGFVEDDGQGRWNVHLEAEPMRVATLLQQAGVLQLQGSLGGTSSHLRPADLELTWRDASLSDVLRLAGGYDYGIRGDAELVVRARTNGPPWDLAGKLQLSGVHRWDLPTLPDSPAVNLNASAKWWPEQSRVELSNAVIEAPASNIRASGILDWNAPAKSGKPANETRIQLLSSGVQVSDLLQWVRAFHPQIAPQLALRGQFGMDATLKGWPPHIQGGALAADGIELLNGRNPLKLHIDRVVVDLSSEHLRLLPLTISLAQEPSSMRVEAELQRKTQWLGSAHAVGQVANLAEILGVTKYFGWSLPQGWQIVGPTKFDLRWEGARRVALRDASGFVETTGLTAQVPFLNKPITQAKARYESKGNAQRILIASAQAFGAHWSGVLNHTTSAPLWQFALKADRLSTVDLNEWLDPQQRPGILERVLPFLSGQPARVSVPAPLRGEGRLDVEQFNLGTIALRRLQSQAAIDGRHIEISGARAALYGGTVEGSMRAELTPSPEYEIQAKFSGVNVGPLAELSTNFSDKFSGKASGDITFRARGIGRDRLLQSLGCNGQAQVDNAEIAGINLAASLDGASAVPGISRFQHVDGNFTCDAGKLNFPEIRFANSASDYEASGTVGIGGSAESGIDLRLKETWQKGAHPGSTAVADSRKSYRLAGALLNPHISEVGESGHAVPGVTEKVPATNSRSHR